MQIIRACFSQEIKKNKTAHIQKYGETGRDVQHYLIAQNGTEHWKGLLFLKLSMEETIIERKSKPCCRARRNIETKA